MKLQRPLSTLETNLMELHTRIKMLKALSISAEEMSKDEIKTVLYELSDQFELIDNSLSEAFNDTWKLLRDPKKEEEKSHGEFLHEFAIGDVEDPYLIANLQISSIDKLKGLKNLTYTLSQTDYGHWKCRVFRGEVNDELAKSV